MVIEVLFADLVDARFFFGVLPLSLKDEIAARKLPLWEALSQLPISAVGRFYRLPVTAEGVKYFVTVKPGESYLAEDGSEVQEIWVTRIEQAGEDA